MSDINCRMPAVALRGLVCLPDMVLHFDVSRKKSIAALEAAMVKDQMVFLVAQKDPDEEDPTEEELYQAGAMAKVKQIVKMPENMVRVVAEGKYRAEFHGPIDPYQGTFITEDRLNNVFDRGEGKGVVCDCAMEVYNIASRPVATLHSYHYNKPFGGFGGPKFVTPKVQYPERKPDYETTEFMVGNIAAIYRLCGDTYENHIDPNYAKKHNFERPFTMGLCTYGFATRMAIQ